MQAVSMGWDLLCHALKSNTKDFGVRAEVLRRHSQERQFHLTHVFACTRTIIQRVFYRLWQILEGLLRKASGSPFRTKFRAAVRAGAHSDFAYCCEKQMAIIKS